MTNPTSSTSPLPPTAEAVKGAGAPQEPPGDSHDLRLFGGGGSTEHYTQFGLPMPPFEPALAVALHRLHLAATPFSSLSPEALCERSSHDDLLAVVQQITARERSAGQ